MGYSVKWVLENLGITRDMLRYYEKEKLISIEETRNPSNNYRDYNEEDIEQIWFIKILIGMGFSAKEIRFFFENPDTSFYQAISDKIKQLEEKHQEILSYLQIAKTVKMMGRIPNVKQIGSMCYDDFIECVRQNWNVYNNPETEKYMEVLEPIIEKPTVKWNETDFQRVFEFLGAANPEQIAEAQILSGYYRVVVDMMSFGYKSDLVQQIIRCLYQHILHRIEPKYQDKFTPLYFADYMTTAFVESDIAELNKRQYGEDGCLFIVHALAYFGGYDLEE